jgi:hypothetical protein
LKKSPGAEDHYAVGVDPSGNASVNIEYGFGSMRSFPVRSTTMRTTILNNEHDGHRLWEPHRKNPLGIRDRAGFDPRMNGVDASQWMPERGGSAASCHDRIIGKATQSGAKGRKVSSGLQYRDPLNSREEFP